MKAVIELDVPTWQIGQEAHIFFPDTMELRATVKEQDAVKPILLEADDGTRQLQCGNCNWFMNFGQVPQMRYCPHCGRKVAW